MFIDQQQPLVSDIPAKIPSNIKIRYQTDKVIYTAIINAHINKQW